MCSRKTASDESRLPNFAAAARNVSGSFARAVSRVFAHSGDTSRATEINASASGPPARDCASARELLRALAPFSPETAAIPAAEASSGEAEMKCASVDIAKEQALASMIIERFSICDLFFQTSVSGICVSGPLVQSRIPIDQIAWNITASMQKQVSNSLQNLDLQMMHLVFEVSAWRWLHQL